MIQAIVNLPPGLPVLDLLKHVMETADVYQLCPGKVPGFKCSVRIKGCDLVHLSVAVTAWSQLLCNTPFSLAFLAKMGSTTQVILHLHRNQQNPFSFVFIIRAGERGFLKKNWHFLKGKKHPCFVSLKSSWSGQNLQALCHSGWSRRRAQNPAAATGWLWHWWRGAWPSKTLPPA